MSLPKIPRFPVYLFDVDGTLVDSAPDICGAIQTVIQKRGRLDVTDEFLRGYIGRHLDDTFADLGFDPSEFGQLLEDYRAVYPLRGHSSTKLYPGVVEMLTGLNHGCRKSTATTKHTRTVLSVFEKFELLPYFDHVQGTDGFPAKPAPDVILKNLEVLQVKPEDCLMIGDAWTDMEAARAAGVPVCAVTYGYGAREDLAKYSPDFWLEDPRQLL
ncbi:MAG: HAD-IA family hydrolase [Acidobacteria bacterium]|nr:HAD-IA family hydrolase [Acidobacteriota bacterium]